MFDNDTLIIVPSRLSQLKIIKDILMNRRNAGSIESNAVINPNIFTFKSLLDNIYAYSFIKKELLAKKIISSTAKFLLLKNIIKELYQDSSLQYFGKIQNESGFINSIIELNDELKTAFIFPDQFKKIALSKKSLKFEEISLIYSKYEEELHKKNLIDSTDKDIISLDTLKKHFQDLPFLNNIQKVEVHHFNDFTPIEYEILKTFAENGLMVGIHFVGDEKREPFIKTLSEVQGKLLRHPAQEGILEKNIKFHIFIPENDLMVQDIYPAPSLEINHLIKNIFSYNFDKVPSNGKVRIISANDPISEIHSICREIKKLLEGDPALSLNEIGVIFRDISENSNDIKRIFAQYDLPIFLRRGELLNKNRIVRLIQSLFYIKRVNFEREVVLKLLTQSYITPKIPLTEDSSRGKVASPLQQCKGVSPYAHTEVSKGKMERIIFKSGVLGGDLNSWLERFDWLKSRLSGKMSFRTCFGISSKMLNQVQHDSVQNEFESIQENDIEYTKKVIGFLFNEINDLVKEQKFIEFISKIKGFIEKFSIKDNTLKVADYNLKINEMKELADFHNLIEELEEVANQLVINDKIISPKDFLDLFNQTVLNQTSSEITLPTDKILVLNPFDARGLSFRVLFITGLNEEIFPRRLFPNPIFKESERIRFNSLLRENHNYPIPTLYEEELKEKILFFLLLTIVKEKLYLSFSRLDLLGKPILKSSLLEEVERFIDFSETDRISDYNDFIIPQFHNCFTQGEAISRLTMELCKKQFESDEQILSDNKNINLFNALISKNEVRHILADIFYGIDKEYLREQYFLREKNVGTVRKLPLQNQWVGYLSSEEVKKRLKEEFGGSFLWGATLLEDYYVCPFQFFLKYSLRIEPFKKPAYEIDLAEEGTIVHKILRDFFSKLKEEKRLPVDDFAKFKGDMITTVNEFLMKFEKENYVGDKDYYEVRKEKIINMLLSLLKKEARQTRLDHNRFIPTFFEFQFGDVIQVAEKPNTDAIIIKDREGREIWVGGLVDRIDKCHDGFRVIDYKGSASTELKTKLKIEEFGNKSFQMPIYILASRKGLSGETNEFQTEEWAFFTYKDSDPYLIKTKDGENASFLDAFFELNEKRRIEIAQNNHPNLANRICEFVNRVLNGDFQTNPIKCERFCNYKYICRYVINRKLGDSETDL